MQLSGIIYMHRISDFRMGGISRRNFSMFRQLCGDDNLKNVIIVTNMWGEVSQTVGEDRETELRENNLFFKPVLDKKAQLLRHNNTTQSAHTIIHHILKNHPMTLRIQEELVDEGIDISETAAGVELSRELAELAKKHKKELRQMQDEMREAIRAKDEETRRELEEETQKLSAEICRVQADSQRLATEYSNEKVRMERRMREMADAAESVAAKYQQEMEHLNSMLENAAQKSAAEKDAIQKQMDDLQRKYDSQKGSGGGGGCVIL